jgi:hypothetical protein
VDVDARLAGVEALAACSLLGPRWDFPVEKTSEQTLGLQPGELVRDSTRYEIVRTLDATITIAACH